MSQLPPHRERAADRLAGPREKSHPPTRRTGSVPCLQFTVATKPTGGFGGFPLDPELPPASG
jgi:hypothetical protein